MPFSFVCGRVLRRQHVNVLFNLKRAINMLFAVRHSDLRRFNKLASNSWYKNTSVS